MSGGREKDSVAYKISGQANIQTLSMFKEFIEDRGSQMNLGDDATFVFKLAVEEVCTNIIAYGYAGMDPGIIQLTFLRESDRAQLTIYDEGQFFDPESVADPDIESDTSDREIGGLGLFMIREMMDRIEYRKQNEDGNLLTLIKNITEE
jgi:serine/threonine-protein kinase RsbW